MVDSDSTLYLFYLSLCILNRKTFQRVTNEPTLGKPVNICMVTNTYLPHVGGVARSVHTFACDLRKRGHQVLVVAPSFEEASEENEREVFRVPAVQNFNGSDFSVRIPIPFLLKKSLDEFQPSLIHSHHPFLMGDAALRTAVRRNLPLVFTHHTLYERYIHYVSLDSSAMRRFVMNLSTHYANMCDSVVAPSLSVARMIKKRGVVSPITEIPTGVDLKFFQNGRREFFRRAHGIDLSAPVLGHVGRLAPEKNLDYLAEAVIQVLKQRPNAMFVVVGAGPSSETIVDRARSEGVESRLVMTGSLTGSSLADAYRSMDLFVFASTSETQGMVLVEAMAAGMPVVAIDAPGAREVVKDGINGRLLPQKATPEEFARAAEQFLLDSEFHQDCLKEATRTAAHFSREASAERLESLYIEVLEHERSRIEEPEQEIFVQWMRILDSIKLEWELLREKAAAAAMAVKGEPREGH
jgi:1,2-diacylglycerol 3-alpha-glucosyltransferase